MKIRQDTTKARIYAYIETTKYIEREVNFVCL